MQLFFADARCLGSVGFGSLPDFLPRCSTRCSLPTTCTYGVGRSLAHAVLCLAWSPSRCCLEEAAVRRPPHLQPKCSPWLRVSGKDRMNPVAYHGISWHLRSERSRPAQLRPRGKRFAPPRFAPQSAVRPKTSAAQPAKSPPSCRGAHLLRTPK